MIDSAGVEERLAALWSGAREREPAALHAELENLIEELGLERPRAQFERASVHDFLGEEDAAIPLYRDALAAGLAPPHRTQAVIQLASSLRNVGDASAALALLQSVEATDPLHADAQAFLSLALHDDDKPTPALRTTLRALAPHLTTYGRAIAAYADELPPRERIRVIVVGLLIYEGRILGETYPATAHHGLFVRAPGGGIDFGETADHAIRREFAEELGVVLDGIRLLGVTENIYAAAEKSGHEIVHVYHVRSDELERLAPHERLPVRDSDTTVAWYDLADLRSGTPPFFPHGVLDLARDHGLC
jgi:ADP-ribose pyrophosphatase YjhB (NUDIX family)